MLQKELAKRLKAQYDTKMDGNGWLEVSSKRRPSDDAGCRSRKGCVLLSACRQHRRGRRRCLMAESRRDIR